MNYNKKLLTALALVLIVGTSATNAGITRAALPILNIGTITPSAFVSCSANPNPGYTGADHPITWTAKLNNVSTYTYHLSYTWTVNGSTIAPTDSNTVNSSVSTHYNTGTTAATAKVVATYWPYDWDTSINNPESLTANCNVSLSDIQTAVLNTTNDNYAANYTTINSQNNNQHKTLLDSTITTDGSASDSSSISSDTSSSNSNNTQNTTTDTTTNNTTDTNNISTGSSTTSSADANNSSSTGPVTLLPSPDILHCSEQSSVLYFQNNLPSYDKIGVNCSLNKNAIVTAHVYNKSYDVKSADNSGNLVKTLQLAQTRSAGGLLFSWDGYDDYDQAANLDDYAFVVEAKLSNSYSPDISIQKFKVENAPEAAAKDNNGTVSDTASSSTSTKTSSTSTTSSSNNSVDTTINSNDSTLHGAATVAATSSKCPGVNYPVDIAGSALQDLIKKAYDDCLVQGYLDGTFRENANLSRAEAAKIAILGSGHIAKQGCYDNDCGSPFLDLQMWQGPWVRAAWDLKMVVGIRATEFAPNRNITKAEASSLLTKAFGWAPYAGCYNAGCGAGYPDDVFVDIVNMWEGPYLRALWDKMVIHSESPKMFFPDKAITRGQFIEMTMKARVASPNLSTAGN